MKLSLKKKPKNILRKTNKVLLDEEVQLDEIYHDTLTFSSF